jgi:hypothetical protein
MLKPLWHGVSRSSAKYNDRKSSKAKLCRYIAIGMDISYQGKTREVYVDNIFAQEDTTRK